MISKIKHITILLLMFIPFILRAQIVVIVNEPVSPTFTLNNAFNFQLLNAGTSSTIQWFGEVYKNNTLVASGNSQVISVSNSNNALTNQSGSFTYNVNTISNQSLNGDLPFGNYRICVKVNVIVNGIQEQTAEDCLDKDYTPLSPPFLLSPENGEELNTPYPLLTWSPPMPVINSSPVIYKLKLVEVLSGQANVSAIQNNLALLDVDNITQPNYQYPFNALALVNGKKYAWRISARSQGYDFGNTETWCFYYTTPVQDTPSLVQEPYIILAKSSKEEYTTQNGKLYVQMDETYNERELKYKIYPYGSVNEVNTPCDLLLTKKQGDNRLVFDFHDCSSFKKGRYRIDFIGHTNTITSLNFVYE